METFTREYRGKPDGDVKPTIPELSQTYPKKNSKHYIVVDICRYNMASTCKRYEHP